MTQISTNGGAVIRGSKKVRMFVIKTVAMEPEIVFKNESYQIIGACFEVHNALGGGLLESVYKEALEHEFALRGIPFEREKPYRIVYKEVVLQQRFYADFVLFNNIILEVKTVKAIDNTHLAQTMNYMKLANSRLGIIANFHDTVLHHKRLLM